jgi:hypothetical protein
MKNRCVMEWNETIGILETISGRWSAGDTVKRRQRMPADGGRAKMNQMVFVQVRADTCPDCGIKISVEGELPAGRLLVCPS